MRQVLQCHSDNVASPREPCMGVPDAPFALETPRPQPLVREGEALTAVVVFLVVYPNRASILEDRAVPRHAVRSARDDLRQVERSIGVMTDAEQEHLPVQIAHPPDRAFGNVGRKRQWVGGDPGSLRSGRREGVDVIASPHTGRSPERFRDDAEARRHGSGEWIEGLVILPRPGRHHQGSVGTECVTERLNQAERPSLDRSGSPEGRVHQQDTAFLDSERAELISDLGPAQLHHSRLHFPRNSPIGDSDSM